MRFGRAQPAPPIVGRRIIAAGTVTSLPWTNNTGTLLASLAVTVFFYSVATGALIVTMSGATDASGIWTFSDGLLATGSAYRHVTVFTVSGAEGMGTSTAS